MSIALCSQLAKRTAAKQKAEEDMAKAKEAGSIEDLNRFSKRTVRMTDTHKEDCRRLLELMGLPVIQAPSEAEAQCAAMASAGVVYAAASEDMDTLTFGAPRLLRRLTFSEARKLPVLEFNHDAILSETGISREEFIDLCILLGCDYLESLRGIGPKRALDLIRTHHELGAIVEALRTGGKIDVPEDYNFQAARRLFQEPDVADPRSIDLKWKAPDEEG